MKHSCFVVVHLVFPESGRFSSLVCAGVDEEEEQEMGGVGRRRFVFCFVFCRFKTRRMNEAKAEAEGKVCSSLACSAAGFQNINGKQPA